MLVSDLQRKKVYRILPDEKRTRRDGTERDPKKLGKIHYPVFTPDGARVVGFMVSLPDVAGMIQKDDCFVSLDAFNSLHDDLVAPNDKQYYDYDAAKRLGIDLDTCIIFTGMDVVTKSGEGLGYCSDAEFDEKTGEVTNFILTEGNASTALIGNRELPASYLLGYRDGKVIVKDEAAHLEFSGGAAAKAAEVSVKVSAGVKKGTEVVDEKGSEALDKGSKALGKQLGKAKTAVEKNAAPAAEKGSEALEKGSYALGKQLGKTKNAFGAFMDEYHKAAGDSPKKKAN